MSKPDRSGDPSSPSITQLDLEQTHWGQRFENQARLALTDGFRAVGREDTDSPMSETLRATCAGLSHDRVVQVLQRDPTGFWVGHLVLRALKGSDGPEPFLRTMQVSVQMLRTVLPTDQVLPHRTLTVELAHRRPAGTLGMERPDWDWLRASSARSLSNLPSCFIRITDVAAPVEWASQEIEVKCATPGKQAVRPEELLNRVLGAISRLRTPIEPWKEE